ncbi:SRPBCC family protein [Aestuariibacter sp. AA17]|uniref:SRPBCC family protein n=1 Tax=Fluctibacter corallii TaxID=2984329 RepID=A0ABT3A9E1_9ALTE|nr:SRPBCC family protein [Aestuariibacter sp. AA17]MCV2885219.1 SRPBCC family protein [Aestuariibacter sp. AA17]
MFKKLLIGVVVVVVGFFAVGFLLPSDFRVERSVLIEAPPEKVFPYVVNLREWRNWGVWFKRDPQMTTEYSGPEAQQGMKSQWTSETEGSGEMELVEVKPNRLIVYSLYFPEFDMGSTGEMRLQEEDGRTIVTWVDYGDVGDNPVNRYFALMMDSMIGPDFEVGLENLKMLAENGTI